MNSLRRMLLAASAAAMMLSTSAFAADANVAGEWDMTVETQAGTGTPHFSLEAGRRQAHRHLQGHAAASRRSPAP